MFIKPIQSRDLERIKGLGWDQVCSIAWGKPATYGVILISLDLFAVGMIYRLLGFLYVLNPLYTPVHVLYSIHNKWLWIKPFHWRQERSIEHT